IDPDLPIVDAHHHLWYGAHSGDLPKRYLLEEFLADMAGHNVIASVYVDCRAMYRKTGPVELRSLGETEFVTGVAAQCASGAFGPCLVGAGIVGKVDLWLGERVRELLELHLHIAGPRFKGIRENFAWVPFTIFGMAPDPKKQHILADPQFRK